MNAASLAAGLLGRPADAVTPVGGGGNNRIFRVTSGGQAFALKFYPADERDRLGAEYGALTFLAAHGMACVPRAMACDAGARAALYQWIDGVRPKALDEADLAVMFALLATLRDLAAADGAAALPPASAACLIPAEAHRQLHLRLERLETSGATHDGLRRFLATRLVPTCDRLVARARDILGECAAAPVTRLFLSPSDFGRHNMLRRPDGTLAFLDFEYFGWDDPVKAISDFALHPGTDFAPDRRGAILARAAALFSAADTDFGRRLDANFPVFGLIWCLILLNEFVPESWARRALAGLSGNRDAAGLSDTREQVQDRQLAKAVALLDWIEENVDAQS
jgi:hypothetical protein